MSAHTTNPKAEAATYLRTLISLLILTAITVGASYINFGSSAINVVVALTIATIKATLVALFFMHVIHSSRLTWAVILVSLVMLTILLVLTGVDYWSRWLLETV